MVKPNQVDRLISTFSDEIRQSFEKNQRIMSFSEYIQLVHERPEHHFRNSAQYIRDAFDYFETTTVRNPKGTVRRFKLFDGLLGSNDYLIGHEAAQNAVYRMLNNFIREGRINRMLLLHGPNGSAKSSLVACIARALELYSQTDQGALYRFNWIFPAEKIAHGSIGFGGKRADDTSNLPTYAYLEDLEVNARVIDEQRDPPLFMLPDAKRKRLIEELVERDDETDAEGRAGFNPSDYILRGDLSDKNKRIYETLLASYHGDYAEVLKHIQVERFFISRRYRVGLATVGPQMRVDANVRQITADKSLSALPPSLQSVTLYEPLGDLVDGNRGIVEFNDLLKRPMDLNRYLLATSETGTVPLEQNTLHLDAFLVGTVNEAYLDALKGQPDWASYKGRFELVRMPYLVDYQTEKKIYDVQIESVEIDKPVAPHVTELAALWAVLTRLRKPEKERYPEAVRELIDNLTPIQKAQIYADGALPEELSGEDSRQLAAIIPDLYDETAGSSDYEGRFGASPRELKTVLLNAAHGDEHPCFSPLALFTELERLIEDPSVYKFLQLKPEGEFHVADAFVKEITNIYLDRVDYEVRSAMGLVEESRYKELFSRYVDNVNHWIRKEKILNPLSGEFEVADEGLMAQVEQKLNVESDAETFRNGIMQRIGAFRVEHPTEPIDYDHIFKRELHTLIRFFFEEHREGIHKIKMNLLRFFDSDVSDMTRTDREQVDSTLSKLKSRFGYTDETVREAIGFLVQHRYDEAN